MRPSWKSPQFVQWSRDHVYLERNGLDSLTRTNGTTVVGTGVEWRAWMVLTSEGDTIATPSLYDISECVFGLLPERES